MCNKAKDGSDKDRPSFGRADSEKTVTPDIIHPLKRADTQNISSLSDRRPAQPGDVLSELRSYWEGLRQGCSIPLRSDIEPRAIRFSLDYTFILERIAPSNARFRLAGRHLIDLMGMEVRGMPLSAVINPSSRLNLIDVLESVFSAPQIAEFSLRDETQHSRSALTARMLLLPLRSDLGDVSRALGCLIAEGQIGSTPRRFDITGFQLEPAIEGMQVQNPSPSHPYQQRFYEGEGSVRWKPAKSDAEQEAEGSSISKRRAGYRLILGSKTTPPIRESGPRNGKDGA